MHTQQVAVPSGPGRVEVHVNAVPGFAQAEHSTQVTAVGQQTGQAVPLVVERRMRWGAGTEGHSSVGSHGASPTWEFAEGGKGVFSTYVAIFNQNAAPMTVRIWYRHENGTLPSQDVTIPASSRVVVGTPSYVPDGAFGISIATLTGHWLFAEAMTYGGAGWTLGHAGPGSKTSSTHWRFAEGSSSPGFDTFFLLTNMSGQPATVTLTYRNAAGTVIGTQALVIPAAARATAWANAQTAGQDFSTEVTSSQPMLAERVMYWPTGSSLLSGGEGNLSLTATAGATDALLAFEARGGPPEPYTRTEGVPGPVRILTDDPAALVLGKPVPQSMRRRAASGELEPKAEGEGMAPLSGGSSLPWYGSHLSVGKKP